MIRSVVKHRYVKGQYGKDKARAHINYISHRRGEDREEGGRKFFDKEREDIDAKEVKQLMYERADERGVAMHKIILSPGLNTDAKEYTRELMEKLERYKGQELEWRAVVHENTDHQHTHVVLMGRDKEGRLVKLDRDDHNKLRQFGDEYLDREHRLERYLDRELHEILRGKEYDRTNDEEFKRLIFGKRDERSRDEDPERDRREFDELDEILRRSFEDKKSPELYPKSWEQRTIEQAGRLSEHHADYTTAMARQRLERIAQESPELAERIQKELDYMREVTAENRVHQGRDRELEHILGFDPIERGFEDKRAERAAESFETDRQARPEQQEQEQDEREDTDPWTGN